MDPRRVLTVLGLTPGELNGLTQVPLAQGQARLKEIQERTKTRYKKLVFELHPDRTGGDPEKTELFKAVTELHQQVQALELKVRPAPTSVRVVHYPAPFPYGSSVRVTTSSTTTSTHYVAARVAFIRVV